MSYTIKQINENGSVDVSFDVDNIIQNLSNVPTDEEGLKTYLENYETAYVEGLKIEKKIK